MRILLVEDDRPVSIGIEYSLKKEGFEVVLAFSVEEGKKAIDNEKIDIALLDITLPDGDGYELCTYIKNKNNNIGLIFVTACDEECNVVLGLDLGGDDYITKPIRIRELISRINAISRRKGKLSVESNFNLIGGLKIDKLSHTVFKNSTEITLTKGEYKLMMLLLENKGQTIERGRLLEKLWDIDGDFVDANTLNVYIRRLREKIEDDLKNPKYIITVRGIGYRWGEN
ncbi:response regulator transcription factor [Clostridium thermobutyricum]|uniref:Stage 0 sporulation protein A homolog n=1 Tax=Clostridium thermobutyricum DSM 4928 TaxID=1121339 RepID=A0A1V4STA5_9CLOT|nr:response regulator transcription factor [Clostridium thermobutyricum]OPX47023.1 transcriptional regulatory protein WalR [Clostridium thermobutyricum DSM 4928]